MFKYLSLATLFCSFPLFASVPQLPSVVDFNRLPSIENGYYSAFDENAYRVGYYSFNYAPELTAIFAYLKRTYNIDTVVETGTFRGGTTVLFSYLFDYVHTIEIQKSTYEQSKQMLQSHPNVQCHLGSSEQVLTELLPKLTEKPLIFYLDAHWDSYWPLLDELKIIGQTHRDNCIIVIDDFKVPQRPEIDYDRYGVHECSYEYIRADLDKVFSAYTLHYLIPKSVKCRAKFIAIPAVWKKTRVQADIGSEPQVDR